MLATLMLGSGALAACGPTLVNFDPSNAKSIDVRPVGGQKVFCPGASFQVEVLVSLQNGTMCSSTDREVGCQGQKDAVVNPKMIRLEGEPGSRSNDLEKFIWASPGDILATADTGVTLRAWLEKQVEGQYQKSVVGESNLTPVYACRMGDTFGGGSAGAPGPDVKIAITTLKTPYYENAALVRVESGGERAYYISPTADQAVHIVSRGGDGYVGETGKTGAEGEDGRDASSGSPVCTRGEAGRDGQDGGPGGPGGDGGRGGAIRIYLDKTASDVLKGRVLAESVGGSAGPGGAGGPGGNGGNGGRGVSGQGCQSSSDVNGPDGRPGRQGQPGPAGRPGQAGPDPVFATATREALFGDEMDIIKRIESAKRKMAK
ncbi:MAG: collagen-like protein [Polyangiaceae bacterium]